MASEDVNLPFTLVKILSNKEWILISSPITTRIYSLRTKTLLCSIQHSDSGKTPRAVADCSLNDDIMLALVGDDKELCLYRLSQDLEERGQVQVHSVGSQSLPKRAVKLIFDEEDKQRNSIVIADRHGDIRSLTVTSDSADPEAKEPQAKKARTENSNGQEEEDEEIGTLLLGHVSMVTDFTLSSFSSNSAKEPQDYIITSDRDEHVRISRWGKRKAGHIVLRYLLGSQEAISSLLTIEGSQWKSLQSISTTTLAKSRLEYPVLLSSEGSKLRIWSLHSDSKVGQREDCQGLFNLKSATSSYVVVDMWRERRREKAYGKGKMDMKKTDDHPSLDDSRGRHPVFSPVITKLKSFGNEDILLTFTLDGATALFWVSLSALISSSTDAEASSHVKCLDLGQPILDYSLQDDDSGVWVWMVCDVRSEIIRREANEVQSIHLAQWSEERKQFSLRKDEMADLCRQPTDRGSLQKAASLVLYDALTLYPKQEFEATGVLDSASADNLIKGGLANYEIPGRPASSANHGNSEQVTRKREKAREEMKKRIEERIGQ